MYQNYIRIAWGKMALTKDYITDCVYSCVAKWLRFAIKDCKTMGAILEPSDVWYSWRRRLESCNTILLNYKWLPTEYRCKYDILYTSLDEKFGELDSVWLCSALCTRIKKNYQKQDVCFQIWFTLCAGQRMRYRKSWSFNNFKLIKNKRETKK